MLFKKKWHWNKSRNKTTNNQLFVESFIPIRIAESLYSDNENSLSSLFLENLSSFSIPDSYFQYFK